MKTLLFSLLLGMTFITAGCYSNTAKDSSTDTTEQSAPTPSRSGGY